MTYDRFRDSEEVEGMKTRQQQEDELRPLLTDGFFETLVLVARTIGWSVDHSEMNLFIRTCWEDIGGRSPDDLPEIAPFVFSER